MKQGTRLGTTRCLVIAIISAIIPTTRQQCGGSCGGSVEIAVTQFGSVVIPCGNVVPSNNTRVNYCNGTSPLALGTDVLYNLTGAQIHQNGNTLYCSLDTQNTIYCYRLNVLYAPYVPSDFTPRRIGPENFFGRIRLNCPLISNPPPSCNWSRYDDNNKRQEVVPVTNVIGFGDQSNNCTILFIRLREVHSGLYECTASSMIGSTIYTFPERYVFENCSLHKLISSQLALSQPPTNLAASDNTTLNCRVSSVTRHTALMWTVDNVTYDTSGTFNTSRGQIVLSFSTFDSAVTCSKSSNLTILNVSMDSEGVYSCSAIDNNSTATSNVSLALSSIIQRSSSSRRSAFVIGGAIAGVAVCLFILAGILMITFLSYQHFKRIQLRNQLHQPDYNYEFDVFMSFAKTETEQVEIIFKTLENSHKYRVVWHHRDFNIGVPSEQNMEDYIMKSRKVILALSPGFLQSGHCKNEFALSYGRLEDNEENCIIPVIISPCTIPKEIQFLRSLRYDGNNFNNFMDLLTEYLGAPICEVEKCVHCNSNFHRQAIN